MGLTPEQIGSIGTRQDTQERTRQAGVANIVNSILKGQELDIDRRTATTAEKVAQTGAFDARTNRGKTALLGVRQYYQNLASQAAANKNDAEVRELNKKLKTIDIIMKEGLTVDGSVPLEGLNAGVLSLLGLTPPTEKTDLVESTIPGFEGLMRMPQSEMLKSPNPDIRKPKQVEEQTVGERVTETAEAKAEFYVSKDTKFISDSEDIAKKNTMLWQTVKPPERRRLTANVMFGKIKSVHPSAESFIDDATGDYVFKVGDRIIRRY